MLKRDFVKYKINMCTKLLDGTKYFNNRVYSHWLISTAIEDYLQREEQYEKEKAEDMERWEHYLITGKAIDHEEVEVWLKDLIQGKPRKWKN